MTREEFHYINERLEYLTVNSDLIDSNVTQMDCLILIANEYSKEYIDAKRRVCERCRHNQDTDGLRYCYELDVYDMKYCDRFEVESK